MATGRCLVAAALLFGSLPSQVHARRSTDAAFRQAAGVDAGGDGRLRQRLIGKHFPCFAPGQHDHAARLWPVAIAQLSSVHAVVADDACGHHKMPMHVSSVARCSVDCPLGSHPVVPPQPCRVPSHQPALFLETQLVRQGNLQGPTCLRVPSRLCPFCRLPIHAADLAAGEDVRGFAGPVEDAAGAGVHLAGAGGVGPSSDRAVALRAGDCPQIKMENCHARMRSSRGAPPEVSTTRKFLSRPPAHASVPPMLSVRPLLCAPGVCAQPQAFSDLLVRDWHRRCSLGTV